MKKLESRQEKNLDRLMKRYPALEGVREDMAEAYLLMEEAYEKGRKLLLAGKRRVCGGRRAHGGRADEAFPAAKARQPRVLRKS